MWQNLTPKPPSHTYWLFCHVGTSGIQSKLRRLRLPCSQMTGVCTSQLRLSCAEQAQMFTPSEEELASQGERAVGTQGVRWLRGNLASRGKARFSG